METFSALLFLCAGNSPVPVNSPHKGQWSGALMLSLICTWINGWAGDLRRRRAHYNVAVMWTRIPEKSQWELGPALICNHLCDRSIEMTFFILFYLFITYVYRMCLPILCDIQNEVAPNVSIMLLSFMVTMAILWFRPWLLLHCNPIIYNAIQ